MKKIGQWGSNHHHVMGIVGRGIVLLGLEDVAGLAMVLSLVSMSLVHFITIGSDRVVVAAAAMLGVVHDDHGRSWSKRKISKSSVYWTQRES